MARGWWYTFYFTATYPNAANAYILTGAPFVGGQQCVANWTMVSGTQMDIQTWRNGSVSNNDFHIIMY